MSALSKFGKSVSGDRDADVFQEESEKDFSFFGGDSVEANMPKLKEREREKRKKSGISILKVDGEMGRLKVKEEDFGLEWGPDEISLLRDRLDKLSGNLTREFDVWRPKFYNVVECLKAFRKDSEELKWGGKLELVFPS